MRSHRDDSCAIALESSSAEEGGILILFKSLPPSLLPSKCFLSSDSFSCLLPAPLYHRSEYNEGEHMGCVVGIAVAISQMSKLRLWETSFPG